MFNFRNKEFEIFLCRAYIDVNTPATPLGFELMRILGRFFNYGEFATIRIAWDLKQLSRNP
jgi:hypothetical protein